MIDAIVTEATTKVNEKVTAGDLTQAQADKILAEVTARAGDFVNMKLPAGLPGLPGLPGPGWSRLRARLRRPGLPRRRQRRRRRRRPTRRTDTTPTTVTG